VQAEGLLARCVAVKVRTADFRTQTRQRTLLAATAHPAVFGRAAVAEFRRWLAERAAGGARGPARLRLLGVRASDFVGVDESRQLGLFERLYSN
jgi:DNA polymerase IV